MAQRRVRHPAFHMGCRRERRVHQHHARPHRSIEMVVDVGGVVARDGNVLEQLAEQAGAGGGEFVKDQMTARQFGEDRKQAGPGRGLQHQIRERDRGGGARHQAERERGGELLQRLALFRAAGVRRQQAPRPWPASRAGRPGHWPAPASPDRTCAGTAPARPRKPRRRSSSPKRHRCRNRQSPPSWRRAASWHRWRGRVRDRATAIARRQRGRRRCQATVSRPRARPRGRINCSWGDVRESGNGKSRRGALSKAPSGSNPSRPNSHSERSPRRTGLRRHHRLSPCRPRTRRFKIVLCFIS